MEQDPANPTEPSACLALVGVPDVNAQTLRTALTRARGLGVRSVVLNAAAPGLRPRELGRSARRDVVSTVRRAGLEVAGLDLFVPPAHFADDESSDRAVHAMLGAIEFATDLAGLAECAPIVGTLLPRDEEAEDAVRAVASAADHAGVRLADHAWPPLGTTLPGIAPALDPATAMLAEGLEASPAKLAARHAKELAGARLSDLDASGRAEAGTGRLKVPDYLVSLAVGGYLGPVAIDVRGLSDPWAAAQRTAEAWNAFPRLSF